MGAKFLYARAGLDASVHMTDRSEDLSGDGEIDFGGFDCWLQYESWVTVDAPTIQSLSLTSPDRIMHAGLWGISQETSLRTGEYEMNWFKYQLFRRDSQFDFPPGGVCGRKLFFHVTPGATIHVNLYS